MTRSMTALFAASAVGLAFTGVALVTPAHADVRDGVTAWEAGDYARAVREWRPLAVAGDADAQFNIAQAYKLGRGVPIDLAQAADWFRRAAAQGHLQAQDNLGLVLYDMGQKGDAIPYLQQSAERGEPRAQFVMGAELFNGERISRDLPRAYAFMKRASDAGLQRAAAALVQMDGAIPLDQRQQGLALASQMEASEGQARLAAMTATAPPRPTRAATIRPTDIPPSAAGTTYAPPGEQAATPAPTVAVAAAAPARMAAPAVAPVAATASSGAWRIQLGAFSTRSRAQGLWTSLSGRLPGAEPDYVAAGAVTRLQAGPYASRAAAERACASVRPAPCFAVSQ
jgi:uncharacterized protein